MASLTESFPAPRVREHAKPEAERRPHAAREFLKCRKATLLVEHLIDDRDRRPYPSSLRRGPRLVHPRPARMPFTLNRAHPHELGRGTLEKPFRFPVVVKLHSG